MKNLSQGEANEEDLDFRRVKDRSKNLLDNRSLSTTILRMNIIILAKLSQMPLLIWSRRKIGMGNRWQFNNNFTNRLLQLSSKASYLIFLRSLPVFLFMVTIALPQPAASSGIQEGRISPTQIQTIAQYFMRLQQAQQLIQHTVINQHQVVSHEQLEAWLDEPDDQSLRHILRALQLSEIKIQKKQAYRESISKYKIDLNDMRQHPKQVSSFCKALPKGGLLHVHPNGTMDADLVWRMLSRTNPVIDGASLVDAIQKYNMTLYPKEVDFFRSLPKKQFLDLEKSQRQQIVALFSLPEKPQQHSFKRFDAIFVIKDLIYQGQNEEAIFIEVIKDFVSKAKKQQVSYIEFTSSIKSPEFRQKLQKLAQQLLEQTGVMVRWNKSFVRVRPFAKNQKAAQRFMQHRLINPSSTVVGIDLLANEKQSSALQAAQAIYPYFDQNKKTNLALTMHAGELGDANNARDASLFGVQRIGHGVQLWLNPLTIEWFRYNKIGIEINLTSNVKLTAISSIAAHPFLNYLRLGIPVALSTDNDGIFKTSIVKECETAILNTDIQYSELRQMILNSIQLAFVDSKTKWQLFRQLTEKLKRFEKQFKAYR